MDFENLLKHTYPKIIETMGGKEKALTKKFYPNFKTSPKIPDDEITTEQI